MKMHKLGLVGVAAFGLTLAFPALGSATVFSYASGNICGGDTGFSLCASVSLAFDDATGRVTMTVLNLSDQSFNPSYGEPGYQNTVLTKIGIFNTGGTYGLVTADAGQTGWSAGKPPGGGFNSSGGQTLEFGVVTDNGVAYSIPTAAIAGAGNNTLTFTFYITGDTDDFVTALNAGTVGISIHGQSGVNGNSTTCLTAGTNENCSPPPPPPPPPTTVPEPATLLLLGTGMAGIAAMRRRRREGIEEA